MASPKALSWQNAENTSNQNPWPIGAVWQVGDLVIAFVATAQSAYAFATPSGWTQLASTTAHGGLFKVMYKFATTDTNENWTTTGGLEVATIYRIANAKPATAPSISSVVTGTGTSADPASISPGSTKDWLYITGLHVTDDVWPANKPSGYSSLSGWNEGDYSYVTNNHVVTCAYKETTATSSDNPGAWGALASSEAFAMYTVAVEPDPNAVTLIQRGAAHSTPGAGAGPTIACTPTAGGAGNMYLCAIGCTYNGGGGISTLTGGGLTWTKVRDNASDTSMVSIWKATGTLTTATITATYIGGNAYDRHIAVFEVLGTTTIGQQVYTAGDTGGNSSTSMTLGLFGPAGNRPFAAAASSNFSGGTTSILLGGDYAELDFSNGYDSALEGGGGGYFGWVTGWSQYTQDKDIYLYDQSGYSNWYYAVIALELGTPWAPPQTIRTVTDGNTAYPGGTGHRRIDYCQNGVWWVIQTDQSTGRPCFFYSTDGTLTWTRQTAMNFPSQGDQAVMFIDKDDYMHVAYCVSGPTYGAPAIRYRRGTPNAGRTSYTWSAEQTPYSGYGSGELANYGIGFTVGLDVIAFKDGTGYQVFMCYTIGDSGGLWYHQLTRMAISSGGTFTPNANTYSGQGGTSGAQAFGALDFRHDATDDKAVQASTPSVYWTFCHIDASHYIIYKKIGYSGGVWTEDAAGEQWITGYGAGYQPPSIAYDGTRILLTYGLNGDSRAWYAEVPEASPSAFTEIDPPSFGGTYLLSWTIGYGANGNPYLLVSGDGMGNDLILCIYNRGTSTWGSWTTIYSGSTSQITVVRRQGPAAKGGIFPVAFQESATSPDVFYTTVLVSGSFTLQAPEEGWGMLSMGLVDPPQSKSVSESVTASDTASVVGPLPTAGMKAWYDFSVAASNLWQDTARTSVVTTNGQVIKGVTDKSSAAKHLSEVTNGPTYTTGAIAGKSVARFDGTNDQLSVAAGVTADSSWTLFIVARKQTTPVSGADTLWASSTQAQVYTDGLITSNYMTTGNFNFGGTPTNVNVLVLQIVSAAELNIWLNGGGEAASLDPDDAFTTDTNFYLGSRVAANWGDYDIGEVVAYDSALSIAGLNAAGASLASKWGTTWTTILPHQIARPTSSFAGTNGSFSLNGAPTVWEALSDQLDTSSIESPSQKQNYGEFANLSDPNASGGHILWCRNGSASGTGVGHVELWQGSPYASGTLIVDMPISEPGLDLWTNDSLVLSPAEANAITNYADLWWHVQRGSGTHYMRITEVWLEVPGV